jgi:hypothetical protein
LLLLVLELLPVCVNDSFEKMSMQVHPRGVPRGKSPHNRILNAQDFDTTCLWLEQKTLISYYVGRTPSKSILIE